MTQYIRTSNGDVLTTAQVGTGLSRMRRHNKTASGYCRTCQSKTCHMTAYIPTLAEAKEGKVWAWEERWRFYMAEPA